MSCHPHPTQERHLQPRSSPLLRDDRGTCSKGEPMHMPSTQRKMAIGYFILAFLGLVLIQTVFFAPQSENLSYRDFKTLLKAGKVIDLLLWERTITGRLSTDGLEGLLPPAKIEELRTSGRGEPHFVTVQVDDPTLIQDLEAAGVQFQGLIDTRWLGTLLSMIVQAMVVEP